VVVRDLALGMLRRGHRPIVYAPRLGDIASEIAARGVPVIDDLRKLAERPDLIHAHHTVPCGEAIIRFPEVPALQTCHAFESWIEAPAHFPQIGCYVAVDEACRDRLVHLEGIAAERVVVLHNAVDLRRIPARPQPLNERPRRALAFGKAAAVPEVRAACEARGIAFETLGNPVGRVHPRPEQDVVAFDLVFATARCALEALCCGCAVIVCDARGFGGLVTMENFATMRARNFGLRCLSEPVTVERCAQEIELYDRDEVCAVAKHARRDADLDQLLDAFERLHAELLTGARRPAIDPRAHSEAVGRFLNDHLPRRPGDGRWPWMAEKHALQQRLEALERSHAEFADRLEDARRSNVDLAAQLRAAEEERAQSRQRSDDAARSHAQLLERLVRTQQEREEARRATEDATVQLAGLKKSRLLKAGRLLRRLARLPARY
jgi:hypothetical protein